jgi:hypothetical protein
MPKKKPKRVRKRLFFVRKRLRNVPKIINTPIDPDAGIPIEKKADVELMGNLSAGWHIHYAAILIDNRGRPYLREVIA